MAVTNELAGAQRSSKQRIVANVLAMGVGQITTFACTLLLFVVIGRYLGPSRFGELILAKAIVMVAWLGATLGMETLITRSVARAPERAGPIASAALVARSTLAIPVFFGVFVFVHVAHLNAETALAAYIYGAAQAVWALERVFLAVFQGREHMALSAKWSIGRNILALALAVFVRWRHGGVVAFAATQIPVEVVLFAATLYWMRNFGRLTWRIPLKDLREVTQGSFAFWTTEVFFTTYLYVDAVILAGLAGTHAVGIYTPATQMLSAAMFLTVVIGPATLPQLSRLGMTRGVDFDRAGRNALALFIVAAVPLTIGAATFSGIVIPAVYGSAYRASVPVAVILSLAILPMFLNFQFSQILAACDRQWRWTWALAGCCVVNPPLNFILIPFAQHTWHNGALGAALAWLATELLEVIYGLILLRSVVFDRTMGRLLLGVSAAGAAQGAALWITCSLWPPAGEALGVVTFAIAAVLLGTVPRRDISLILRSVLRRAPSGSTLISQDTAETGSTAPVDDHEAVMAIMVPLEPEDSGSTVRHDPIELKAVRP
jgi:O-antigen/teichoic acid export membrane protein